MQTFLGAASRAITSAASRFDEAEVEALSEDLHDVLVALKPH